MATPEQINLLLSKAEWKWATLVNESLLDFQNGCPMCFNSHLERMWELISALTYQLEIEDYTSETTQNIYNCLFLLVQEDDPNPNTDPNFQYDDQVLIIITDNLNPDNFVRKNGPGQTITSVITFSNSPIIPAGTEDFDAVNVNQLNTKEDVDNKSTDVDLGESDILYPSQKAVKEYVDNHIAESGFVPYNGALEALNMGFNNITVGDYDGRNFNRMTNTATIIGGANYTATLDKSSLGFRYQYDNPLIDDVLWTMGFNVNGVTMYGNTLFAGPAGSYLRAYYAPVNALDVVRLGDVGSVVAGGTTSQYFRGDKTFQTLNTTAVAEGTNLYYTQARFDSAFSAKSTTNLTEGTNLYYTAARFDNAFAAKSTGDLTEGTNKYYTDARVQTFSDARYEQMANKGIANGYAPLNASAMIDAAYLPSYVSDIVTVSTYSALPATGTAGFIYITADTNFEYRWNAGTSAYIRLVASPGTTDALAEGVTNLYYTDARVATYGNAHYAKLTGGNTLSGAQNVTDGTYGIIAHYGAAYGGLWASNVTKNDNTAGLKLSGSYTALQGALQASIDINGTTQVLVNATDTFIGNQLNLYPVGAGSTADDILTLNSSNQVKKMTLGAGVFTALGVDIGNSGAPVLFNGAGGTPSSMVGTNIRGLATLSYMPQKDISPPENAPAPFSSSGYQEDNIFFQGASGKIAIVYREGTTHASDAGVFKINFSTNGGATWSSSTILVSSPGVDIENPGGGVTPTGRWILWYITYNYTTHTPIATYYIYSDDEGVTWSSPNLFITGGGYSSYGATIAIADGKLLTPIYNSTSQYVTISSDNGLTWGSPIMVNSSNGNEGSFAYLGGSVIIGVVRPLTSGRFLQYISTDNGTTWNSQGTVTFDTASHLSPWLDVYSSISGRRKVSLYYTNRTAPGSLQVITASASDLINNGVSGWVVNTLTTLVPSIGTNGNQGYPAVIHPNNSAYALVAYYYGAGSTTAINFLTYLYPETDLFGKVASPLSQFAATTSAQLAGVMSDETGTGALVFGTSPSITTPTLVAPTADNITLTGTNVVIQANGATTSGAYARFANTGGDARFGVNNSAGTLGAVNGSPYSTFISSGGAANIDFSTSGGLKAYIDDASGAFVSKYSIQALASSAIANSAFDGGYLNNQTAATLGNQQYSPALHLTSQGWQTGTGASQQYDWQIYDTPIQSAGGSHNLLFRAQTAGGGYTTPLTLTSGGALTTLGATTSTNFAVPSTSTAGFSFAAQSARANASTMRDYYASSSNYLTSNSSTTYWSAGFSPLISNSNTANWTSAIAFGGAFINPGIQSSATGTITGSFGAYIDLNHPATGLTLTAFDNIRIDNPTGTGPITTLTGIMMNNLTRGTNNTNIFVGTTKPTGNWNIHTVSAYNNYLGTGNTLINTTTDNGVDKLQVNGTASISSTLLLGVFTVATLPAAGTAGRIAVVSDATAPTYLGALTGGGAVKTPVFDNGTAWVSF